MPDFKNRRGNVTFHQSYWSLEKKCKIPPPNLIARRILFVAALNKKRFPNEINLSDTIPVYTEGDESIGVNCKGKLIDHAV